jgi:hypothetical protein
MRRPGRLSPWWLAVLALATAAPPAGAQRFHFGIKGDTLRCGGYERVQAVVWYGASPRMTIERLAAYCAPVIWFSPDEPLLMERTGKAITIPDAFPFEPPGAGPVVYYRVRSLQTRSGSGSAYSPAAADRGASVIDLAQVAGLDLDYFFYYSAEMGLGAHAHDVESAQLQVVVWKRDRCKEAPYHLVVTRVLGKAHGIPWYDNTLEVDEDTRFPIHILSEEGKHASCTDKNADGYFTPSYDVNRHVNDAWGVRDIISAGTLFTGGYQSWMSKIRRPEHRVFPPLPADSPLRARYSRGGTYAPANAVYELRPFPSAEKAEAHLKPFIEDKGSPDWPDLVTTGSLEQIAKWTDTENFTKSISASLYLDGNTGFSIAFPFFIVKNMEDPMAGGFITHRMAFTDEHLRDFTWMLNYSASASRWIDPYFAGGVEWDEENVIGGGTTKKTNTVLETGIKLRSTVHHTPLEFMSGLTPFWGLRFGVKANGFFEIDRLRYVIEFGAGTW